MCNTNQMQRSEEMNILEKIVVLIDADNTQLKKIELVLQEISTHGRIVVKRAYGNWKKDSLKNWEDEIKRLAIKAEQQFDYVSGKNATDKALVIDAIELLNSKIYDAFVIVASDSDYTPLSIKLHETGAYVIGVGEKKTPESFRNSCDEFVYLENLKDAQHPEVVDPTSNSQDANQSESKPVDCEADLGGVHVLLRKAWGVYQDDDEYVNVSSAGTYIKRAKPDFDVRSYGYPKLPAFLQAFPDLYNVKKYKGKGTVNIIAYKCIKHI